MGTGHVHLRPLNNINQGRRKKKKKRVLLKYTLSVNLEVTTVHISSISPGHC
jgi:hypothetical protein